MNSNLIDSIKNLSKINNKNIVDIRHHLHANPELSFQEFETSKYVKIALENIGISKIEHKADTGLVALIEGKNPSVKTIALRADMDALPIKELNNVAYKSKNEGVMHACGHDVHTSCLLGAAQILFNLKNEFEGTIKLIFQPGEEKLPGGASMMIKEGVLKNPDASAIIGQHVMPLIPVGKVGFKSGLYMASTDELYVKVIGKGGHGAMPQLNIDPVVIAAQIIISLQQIVSRMSSPIIPSVLSFGKVIANGATNVIPNEVKLMGTFRAMDETWRAEAHRLIEKISKELVHSMGGEIDVHIDKGYPAVINNEEFQELHGIKLSKKEREITLELYKENKTGEFIYREKDSWGNYTESTSEYISKLESISYIHIMTYDHTTGV